MGRSSYLFLYEAASLCMNKLKNPWAKDCACVCMHAEAEPGWRKCAVLHSQSLLLCIAVSSSLLPYPRFAGNRLGREQKQSSLNFMNVLLYNKNILMSHSFWISQIKQFRKNLPSIYLMYFKHASHHPFTFCGWKSCWKQMYPLRSLLYDAVMFQKLFQSSSDICSDI